LAQRIAIAEAFLTAAVEPEGWLRALALLAEATGSDRAQIVGYGPGYGPEFNWVNDVPPGMLEAFGAVPDGASPRGNFRIAANLVAPAPVLHEAHYDAVRPTLASAAYTDLCHDWHIPYGCQANIHTGPDGLLGLALLRSTANGRTTPEQRALFDTVRGDVAAAARLQMTLEGQGHRLLAGTFEAMDIAAFVLDRRMRVRAMSAPAERLLHGGALRLAGGELLLPGAAARALAQAFAGVATGTPAREILTPALRVKLHRLPASDAPMHGAMGFAPYAILVAEPLARAPDPATALRTRYRLTATETEIALLLRAGKAREEICARRGITRETLRSHLRAIFAKLGVRRETEAIHVLLAVTG